MPQITPTKTELTIKDNQIVLLEGKNLRFRGRRNSQKGLSSEEIYERKKKQRLERARRIQQDSRLSDYIDWISNIQRELGLTNAEFASCLGISTQSVKLWKRRTGHFPSRRTLLKLLELELEARIPVKVIRIRYGVRM